MGAVKPHYFPTRCRPSRSYQKSRPPTSKSPSARTTATISPSVFRDVADIQLQGNGMHSIWSDVNGDSKSGVITVTGASRGASRYAPLGRSAGRHSPAMYPRLKPLPDAVMHAPHPCRGCVQYAMLVLYRRSRPSCLDGLLPRAARAHPVGAISQHGAAAIASGAARCPTGPIRGSPRGRVSSAAAPSSPAARPSRSAWMVPASLTRRWSPAQPRPDRAPPLDCGR
jgi:hypothetical protein